MLRSLFAYKGTHARTLGFQVGEKFLEIGTSRDPNWLHVISERGSVGYVPKNYMGPQETGSEEMLEFIDGCIEATHLNASERGGTYSRGEHEALTRLVELRQHQCPTGVTITHSKRPAPPPPPPQRAASLGVDSMSGQNNLPSPSLPATPRVPSLPPNGSTSSLGPPPLPAKEGSGGGAQHGAAIPETTTSFMGRGDSLVCEDSSGGSSEGHDTSIGYESELRSDVDSGVQASIRSLVSQVPGGYLRNLVEEVRSTTSVSYATSHYVVEIVLKSLGNTLPALHPLCTHILASKEDLSANSVGWRESGDGLRLAGLLERLRECKDDEQQRSWALHEDEHVIATHLTQLLDLLNNGDLEACRSVLSLDDFRPLLTLVQYYQMETRWPLRKLLLQVFGSTCQMSAANISYLSASIFPVELAREMLDTTTVSEERLQYISLVLGMVLCMGDTLPYPHFTVMNEGFLSQLLEGIERYHEDPDTEQLSDLYLTLVLAFNLQYPTLSPPSLVQKHTRRPSPARHHSPARHSACPPPPTLDSTLPPPPSHDNTLPPPPGQENTFPPPPFLDAALPNGTGEAGNARGDDDLENILIKLLAQRQDTKYFTEKLLLLFNREEDPLAMFEHEPRPCHSVLKMMQDMYANRATAASFYTNDERVVCDIIIRQLIDLPADDARRGEYLHLLAGLVGCGGWMEHEHRREEAAKCCHNILAEEQQESAGSSSDQRIVRVLLEAHPHFFREH